MELKLVERLVLLQVLPHEGSFATLKIVQKLKSDLAPSEEEFKEMDIKDGGEGRIEWSPEKDLGKEIPIGEKASDIIVMSLKKLDRDGTLTLEQTGVFEKFIKGD
jgi:hypothetical protein